MELKKVRIGVIGAGHWGPNLIRAFQEHPRSEVTRLCDQNPMRLAQLEKQYPGLQTSQAWEAIAQDPNIDAVVIATPTTTHYAIAKQALMHGKHVFVEKPLATRPLEAAELCEIAQSRGRQLMVGHVFLFNPAVIQARELIRSNELGEVLYLYSTRTNFGPIREDVSALWDLAAHDVSMFLYLLGEDPLAQKAYGTSFIHPPNEDIVFGQLRFRNNVIAAVHVSWLDPIKVRKLVIVGTRKMLLFDDIHPDGAALKLFEKTVIQNAEAGIVDTLEKFRASILEGPVSVLEIPKVEPLQAECDAFLGAVLEGRSHPSTGHFGIRVVQVLESMEKSMRKESAYLQSLQKDVCLETPKFQ